MGKQKSHPPNRLHAVVFDDPEKTLAAVKRLTSEGFHIDDVHSPFPLHGIEKLLNWRETRMPWGTFLGGCAGLILGALVQVWTHAIDWPLNIGGKTNYAWPALIPVGFELTVLLAAFATGGVLIVRLKLYPRLSTALPRAQPNARTLDDAFTILVCEGDGDYDPDHFRDLMTELEPLEVDYTGRREP